MDLLTIFLIFIIIVLILDNLFQQSNNNVVRIKEYEKKHLMTNAELDFYNKIAELEEQLHIKIIPQIGLSTIVKPKKKSRYINELFKNIDFAIFDDHYNEILLLIELNDFSHNNKKRKERDKKVKSICESADIKIINFYTKYPNEKNYVKNRIIENLKYVPFDQKL